MGKNKPNAFTVFVRDEFHRMQRAGENPIFPELFSSLGPKWKELPEEKKQRYKDRASNVNYGGPIHPNNSSNKNNNNGSQNSQWRQTNQQGAPSAPANQQPTPGSASNARDEPKPSTSAANMKQETKVKMEPGTFQEHVDTKPTVVKMEVDRKRPHWAVEVYQPQEQQQQQQDEQQNDEQDPFGHAHKRQKKPAGYGIPNWRNIKNSTQPDADRYFDYHLVERRDRCRSIVETRADALMTIPIYTFSCNVLCRHKDVNKNVRFIPIEIGIYTYTIKRELKGRPAYHVLINAGPPPKNYVNDSIDHSKRTHKIGFTRGGEYPREARNDYRTIYKEMCKYTKEGERTILVADHRDLQQVTLSIEWLYEQASETDKSLPRPGTWTILPLIDFVTEAYNFVHMKVLKNPRPRFTLNYFLRMLLETSHWDYEEKYMCSFHKHEDKQTKWCAQNCAIRSIKCLARILDEIYENFELAARLDAQEATPPPQEPIPTPAKDGQAVATPQTAGQAAAAAAAAAASPQNQRADPVSTTPRPAIQQRLQPLYRCPI